MRRTLLPLLLVACSQAPSSSASDGGTDSSKPLGDAGRDVELVADAGEDAIADAGPDTYKDPGSGRCKISGTFYSCPDAGDPLTFVVCTTVNGFQCKQVEKCQDFTPPCPFGRDCQLWLYDGGVLEKLTGICE